MATIVSIVASTPYLLRYRMDYDGAAPPEVVARTNAQLLTDMNQGPLRTLFNVSGLTLAQARNRCLWGPDIRMNDEVISGLESTSVDVTVDGSGRPGIQVTFALGGAAMAIVGLEFRHSLFR